MADIPKASGGKPTPHTSGGSGIEMSTLLIIIIVLALVSYVSTHITPVSLDTLSSGDAFSGIWSFIHGKTIESPSVQSALLTVYNTAMVVGVVLFVGFVVMMLRSSKLHHHEHKKYAPVHVEETEAKGRLIQWQFVLDHINSENPAEWKLGILEADNMLDEILEAEGYTGATVAEKLKSMNRKRLTAYDELWDAHKLRNQIAHGGAIEMDLSKKVARDTITNFGKAFKELGYI